MKGVIALEGTPSERNCTPEEGMDGVLVVQHFAGRAGVVVAAEVALGRVGVADVADAVDGLDLVEDVH